MPTRAEVSEIYKLAGFDKAAARKKKRKYTEETGVLGGIGGYFGGALAGAVPTMAGQLGIPSAMTMEEHQLSDAQLASLRRNMGVAADVDVVHLEHTMADGMGPRFQAGLGGARSTVHSSRDASVMAHELGHAARWGTGLGQAIILAKRPGRQVAGLAALGSAVASADDDTRSGRIAKWAPAVAALGVAPTLIDEAGASLRAMKALKQLNLGHAAEATARKRLLLAGGSYLGQGIGLAVTPWAVRQIKKKITMPTEKGASGDPAANKRRRHAYYMRNREQLLAHSRMYRMQNAAQIQRKQKRYRREVGMGVRKQKRRLSVGGHSYVDGGFR